MSDYAWLKSVCDPESTKGVRANPWCIEFDGREVTVATDNRLLVAVDSNHAAAPPIGDEGDKIVRQITSILKKDGDKLLGRVTSADLSAWCGRYETDVEKECDCCGGDGQCNRCQCEAVHDCGACDGTGKQNEPVVRYGKIGDSFVDRNRLAKALDHLSGDFIQISEVPTKLIRFEGPGWSVIVAYMVDGNGASGEVPALTVEPPATITEGA